MTIYFILRSNDNIIKKIKDDLKISTNRGRDEYPETLTNAFSLLVKESEDFNVVMSYPQLRGTDEVEEAVSEEVIRVYFFLK